MSTTPLLQVEDLNVSFFVERGQVLAVRGVSFDLASGEAVAVLGESGSGKSVTSRALMGLIDSPPGKVTGSVKFEGTQVVGASQETLRQLRGLGIAMVFQDSLDALNPAYTIGHQLSQVLRVRGGLGKEEAWQRAGELAKSVGIVDAEARLKAYPHQLSGGMRQRICIALAIGLGPQVLIADEPTTALDVTVQAEILELLRELQTSRHMAMLFVTHDIAVAQAVANRIIVMYAGQIVERGIVSDIAERPAHPYTRALLASRPAAVKDWDWHNLKPIGGAPPDKARTAPGCAFAPRCPLARPMCHTTNPPTVSFGDAHQADCHIAQEVYSHEL